MRKGQMQLHVGDNSAKGKPSLEVWGPLGQEGSTVSVDWLNHREGSTRTRTIWKGGRDLNLLCVWEAAALSFQVLPKSLSWQKELSRVARNLFGDGNHHKKLLSHLLINFRPESLNLQLESVHLQRIALCFVWTTVHLMLIWSLFNNFLRRKSSPFGFPQRIRVISHLSAGHWNVWTPQERTSEDSWVKEMSYHKPLQLSGLDQLWTRSSSRID